MAATILPQDGKLTRCAIYARVSTLQGQDVTMQTRELQTFAEARGWTITGHYIDEGHCGAKDSRPGLNRIMADAKRRKCDVILVWKVDRFGRSLRHLVNAIVELESVGVAFVSLTDNLDLSTPSGRLMFQVIAAMGEFERELIRERVRAGLRNAKAKGRTLGRPGIGVDASKIASMRTAGRSMRQIAAELKCSPAYVHKICSRLAADPQPIRVANAAD
jgi:DNA invertase Pin-like site-specific DNA recombinase